MESGFILSVTTGRRRSTNRTVCCRGVEDGWVTSKDLEEAAQLSSVKIVDRCAGPILAFDAVRDEERIGFVNGYIVPGMRRVNVDSARVTKLTEGEGSLLNVSPVKILTLMMLVRAAEQGCEDAFLLAINDEAQQHKRLLKYMKYAGFTPVRKVGGSIKDVPDRLLWGGNGTICRAHLPDLLTKWAPIVRRSVERLQNST